MVDSELVQAIFDAPIIEDGWHVVLERLATNFEPGDLLTLMLRAPHEHDPGEIVTNGMSDADRALWLRTMVETPGLVPQLAEMPAGAVRSWTGSPPDLSDNPWAGQHPSAISGQLWQEGREFGFLFMGRATQRPFSDAEQARFAQLVPLLCTAAETHRRLALLKLERDSARNVLDQLGIGVILVASEGEVLHANRKATALLDEGDGIALSGGRLHAVDDRAQAQLQRTLDESIATGLGGAPHPGGAVPLPRSGDRPAVESSVFPISLESSSAGYRNRPAAVAFLTDPEDLPQLTQQRLARLYRLTPMEVQLASHLARGGSLDSAAQEFDRSRDTLRKHLQSAFEKTGTHRQSELVALLLRGRI